MKDHTFIKVLGSDVRVGDRVKRMVGRYDRVLRVIREGTTVDLKLYARGWQMRQLEGGVPGRARDC